MKSSFPTTIEFKISATFGAKQTAGSLHCCWCRISHAVQLGWQEEVFVPYGSEEKCAMIANAMYVLGVQEKKGDYVWQMQLEGWGSSLPPPPRPNSCFLSKLEKLPERLEPVVASLSPKLSGIFISVVLRLWMKIVVSWLLSVMVCGGVMSHTVPYMCCWMVRVLLCAAEVWGLISFLILFWPQAYMLQCLQKMGLLLWLSLHSYLPGASSCQSISLRFIYLYDLYLAFLSSESSRNTDIKTINIYIYITITITYHKITF